MKQRFCTIFLSIALAACWLPFVALAQLSGIVLDEQNEPLPYASVYVRNSTNGTAANANGEFQLNLTRGEYEIVFQYIGYNQKIETVRIGEKPVRLRVQLTPNELLLSEVTITGDDPADAMMRQVIARRRYYKNQVDAYSSDVYIKGLYKFIEAPKKLLGQEVGNLGGILDSNRMGIVYLSESVSKVYVQDEPPRKKEVMVSSKVSGDDRGFSLNRATLTEFNLYDERLEVEREILSPLADNAFAYYKFRFLGRYRDKNGYDICKIALLPRRPTDPTFSGYLYIVDEQWNLAGADLTLTGAAIKQPVLDTLRIQQEFVPVEKPDTWRLLTQVTSFQFGIFGFKIGGFFNGVFSNYDLHPKFEDGFFDRETFKIEQSASEQDSSYWLATRPMPLTQDEAGDYVKKDSLQRIWKSEAYLDSMDRRSNKFKPIRVLLSGYEWRNSHRRTSISTQPAILWLQFNTVVGRAVNIQPEWTQYKDEDRTRFWRVKGQVNYGLTEKRLRSSAAIERRFESIHYTTAELSGGLAAVQFNDRKPIGPFTNMLYSLFDKRNYMKLYEKAFVRAEFSRVIWPGFRLRASTEWADRRELFNTSDISYYKKDDHDYTSNRPFAASTEPLERVEFPRSFTVGLEVRLRPAQTYSTYPRFRVYDESQWPDLYLRYRKALPGVGGSTADYDFMEAQLRKENLSWGLAGFTDINVSSGLFLQSTELGFMDFHHPLGNQTLFGKPVNYNTGFLQLPYYAFSTDQPYVEAHVQHHLQGWLLDKIPGLRRLNWKEVLGASVYYADQPTNDPTYPYQLPYWEFNVGFENIGFKAFRMFRLDVVTSFFGGEYYRTGLVLGVGL